MDLLTKVGIPMAATPETPEGTRQAKPGPGGRGKRGGLFVWEDLRKTKGKNLRGGKEGKKTEEVRQRIR